MLNRLEKRLLYLLRKSETACKLSELSQGASKYGYKAPERLEALASLEGLDLISSAKQPPKKTGGRATMLYWLTEAGLGYCNELIERGEMRDPVKA